MENLDLLFAKVGEIDKGQQKLEAKVGVSAQVMEQMLKDQQLLAKQMELTGQAVAQLTLSQKDSHPAPPPSPTSSVDMAETSFRPRHGHQEGLNYHHQRNPFAGGRFREEQRPHQRSFVPKLTCPRFDGKHPGIWKAKCEDYFHLLSVPDSMWTTVASLHMDDNAEKWLQLYKLKHGLGSWEQFMTAVQNKFGAYDYKHAIESLLELQQTGTVEDYASEFEALQYQISLSDQGIGDTFFVSQFVKGLKNEIRYPVQGQLPDCMERAIILAKIQEQIQSKGKVQFTKFPAKTAAPASKEQKSTTFTSHLGKERQMRDYCRANNLCFYCKEPYDANHAAKCTKRPQAQVNALAINDLDTQLTDE